MTATGNTGPGGQPAGSSRGGDTGPPAPGTWRWLYFRKRFHPPLRAGTKTHTLRRQRIPPGSLVACPVGLILVESAVKATPAWVADHLWREEGCHSREDFLSEFGDIHADEPGVFLDRPMWLHRFRLVQAADSPEPPDDDGKCECPYPHYRDGVVVTQP